MEQPAEQLQGAEGSGGGTPQQPAREPHAVQQTSQAGQHCKPCEYEKQDWVKWFALSK